jgi:hypothetical protein
LAAVIVSLLQYISINQWERINMLQLKLAVPFVVVALTTGCASITSDKTQSLAVTTHTTDGKLVEKAKCSLKNDKGEWKVETPGAVVVRRSAEDIVVECKKDGEPDGIARGISRAAGGMWGNIVFGGGIGAVIDHTNGTGYNYPNDLPVKMGASVSVDQADERKNKQAQPQVQAQAAPSASSKN